MKRNLFLILSFLVLSVSANAAHIKGGFFRYEYLGPGSPGNLRYHVTLTVYMICDATTLQQSPSINFSFFDAGTNQLVKNSPVSITNKYFLSKNYQEPCISDPVTGCYYLIVIYDLPSVELPTSANGYTIAYQRCCRINGINNVPSSNQYGATFTASIPGTALFPGAETNSSPVFPINDTAVVCRNNYFEYSFEASDPDGDSLSYSFCSAFTGGGQTNGNGCPTCPDPNPATNPPYSFIPYNFPFSGSQPMGPNVTIDQQTGIISGIAPDFTGEYVVSVCVSEFRNNFFVGTTRKELHIRVKDCQPLAAILDPSIITCDGFTLNFKNNVTNPTGTEYKWIFGEPASGSADTSLLATPTHTYLDTGVYTVKLVVSLAGGICADSTTMLAKVYPGFFPAFSYTGSCYLNPFDFTDNTTAAYGVVNGWSWNFGDGTTLADTSHIQNPQWLYPDTGPKKVLLTVSSSKGCMDTTSITIDVLDKPLITLGFADTLICTPDNVQLNASGTGNFSWTPNTNINNPNIPTPTVNPTTSTWYYVRLDANGCINTDSVHVRVVDHVTLSTMPDSTICLTDPVQLTTTTDGLRFQWTPSGTLDDPNAQNPVATPTAATTNYQVTASVGSCSATDNVIITTVPYPIANAGPDQTICYNTATQLNASQNGSSFFWTPVSYLSNPNILNPIVTPPRTTTYILASLDTLGCPKPGFDTITVTVQPKIHAFAGRDTSIVIGQPLQLQGSGGVSYVWSPPTGLSNTMIPDPIATLGLNDGDSIRYKMITKDASGCPDSAYVTVYIFKTNPYVFVPTAFTPNNDGKNDILRPIAVGVEKINYFSIYNRWGQMVFTTTQNGQGWDGRIAGVLQASNVYVWMVSAVDYTGKLITLKGTVMLIR